MDREKDRAIRLGKAAGSERIHSEDRTLPSSGWPSLANSPPKAARPGSEISPLVRKQETEGAAREAILRGEREKAERRAARREQAATKAASAATARTAVMRLTGARYGIVSTATTSSANSPHTIFQEGPRSARRAVKVEVKNGGLAPRKPDGTRKPG